jgi:hypothetical protein
MFYRINNGQRELLKRDVLTEEELDEIGFQLKARPKKSLSFGSSVWTCKKDS